MRKPTGPGQIETRPVNVAPGAPIVVEARLFNFDIDDATVKKEHQDWLDENVVTPFRRNPNFDLLLQGCTSQSGANDYNMKLSLRRVDAVKFYLTSKGVPSARIETTFTGEELSTSTNKEDPRDRAVKVLLESAPTPPVRFQENRPLTGFEVSTSPNGMDALIVPVGGQKLVNLANPRIVGRLIVQKPGSVLISPPQPPFPTTLQLTGVAEGITVLEAWDPTQTILLAELELVVKKPLLKSIAFHIVTDNATPPHLSTRGSANIRQLFNALNTVYTPQSNVVFSWDGTVKIVRVDFDLGPKVEANFPPVLGQEWNAIVNQGDSAASLRGFFVHDFDFLDTQKDEFGGAGGIPARDFMMGDDTPANFEVKVIAHEIGHCLGLKHEDAPTPDHLISNARKQPPGLIISRKEADIINPSARGTSPKPRLQRR